MTEFKEFCESLQSSLGITSGKDSFSLDLITFLVEYVKFEVLLITDAKLDPLIKILCEEETKQTGEYVTAFFSWVKKHTKVMYYKDHVLLNRSSQENNGAYDMEDYLQLIYYRYMLAALARSHKGSYGEFAQTTYTYLKDAKLSGLTPEFVAQELFERGVLSCIPSMLLRTICGDDYAKLSVGNQTKMIQKLDLTPNEIETSVVTAQKSLKRSLEIVEILYQTMEVDTILKALHRIGNGTAKGVYPESISSFIEKHLKGEDDCPFCNGRKVLRGFNSLKAKHPVWFEEWSYQNNYLLCDPDQIRPDYNENICKVNF